MAFICIPPLIWPCLLRYLGHLKSYVRNKAQPEGSIAEGYLVEEILTFCSRYFDDSLETRFNWPRRVDDAPNDNIIALGLPNIF